MSHKLSKEDKALLKKFESRTNISIRGALRYDCGELLGRGLNRDVYVCKHNPNYVVKIQRTVNFDNIIEWEIWGFLWHTDWYRRWFADCITITESGLILVQKRVTHGIRKDYPKKVPKFFTDFKIQNYGWIGDQFVCCDYSNVLGMLTGFMTKDLRTAKWWICDNKPPKRKKSITIQTEL